MILLINIPLRTLNTLLHKNANNMVLSKKSPNLTYLCNYISLKGYMTITFSSPRAQPEVVLFDVT